MIECKKIVGFESLGVMVGETKAVRTKVEMMV